MPPSTTRTEVDSMGPVEVPIQALWGAQTARSLQFFSIGSQLMPIEIIHAIAWIKWAAARVNADLHLLDEAKAKAIELAARRVADGEVDDQFPLSVWQTGSGTQSHMNVNEVIASMASAALQVAAGPRLRVDAHDDVNLGQSSNDVFPSAMHIAVALRAKASLLPALTQLRIELAAKGHEFRDVVKIGRTHLQDATPMTLGQEFGGYEAQLAQCDVALRHALQAVHRLALGGTAVGTGVNTHAAFGPRVASLLAQRLDLPLAPAANLFAALAGHEALVAFHGALRMLAVALLKIGNDIRWLGSGPRAGLAELELPANEPGSSIMPGKVNPTQIEALTMVCAQVMGHDSAVAFAASQGQFELNVYKPLIALDVLDSLRLLSDAMFSFSQHCLSGLKANRERLQSQLDASLMLATALTPHIGYEPSARIAQHALAHGQTLREAALALGAVTAEQFDAWVDPRQMLGPREPAPPRLNGALRPLPHG